MRIPYFLKKGLIASLAVAVTAIPITLAGSIVSKSPYVPDFGLEPIKLGLDLQGGSRIILGLDEKEVLEHYQAEIRNYLTLAGGHSLVSSTPEKMNFERTSKGGGSLGAVKEFSDDFPKLSLRRLGTDTLAITGFDTSIDSRMARVIKRNIDVINARLNALGTADVTVYKQGDSKVVVELPNDVDLDKAKKLLTSTSKIGMYLINMNSQGVQLPYNGTTLFRNKHSFISGSDIQSATPAQDPQSGQPIVSVRLTGSSGKRVSGVTSKNLGGLIATALTQQQGVTRDGQRNMVEEVLSVATIAGAFGRDFKMTGLGSLEQCEELAVVLTSGVMEVPMDVVGEQVVDAKFGAENIEVALKAMLLGVGALFLYIIFKYGLHGVVTCYTLLVSGSLLVLALSFYDAVFTLMGIAGLVLTMGIAVDMNVIVFEKAKELKGDLKVAYETSFSTILDANVTTFIAAALLFQVGSVQLKGFALVLGLGVLGSLLGSYAVNKILMTKVFFVSNDKECSNVD